MSARGVSKRGGERWGGRTELAEEDVSNDPDRTHRGREVHAREGRHARSLNVEDVIDSLDLVCISVSRALKKEGERPYKACRRSRR